MQRSCEGDQFITDYQSCSDCGGGGGGGSDCGGGGGGCGGDDDDVCDDGVGNEGVVQMMVSVKTVLELGVILNVYSQVTILYGVKAIQSVGD